ncbi:protealysin inhibitor emfourin [Arthrobacter sp.]|uniref:protealysin inhibitor emfourin n=1 Tax=Arthrobacter sp. TaxID=1667 RepID=UPI0028A08844|nr:protealysin inhibitor emfourin [Arthrobacter sp.]
MKLVVVRSGGIAGMRRKWSSEVSSQEAEERWLPLLQDPPSADPPAGVPDRFTYEIWVGQNAVTIPEASLKGGWRELVDRARQGSGEARHA